MTELIAGAHTPVPAGELTLLLRWAGGSVLDASAVLVAANGRVRSDDDLVFYNQPQAEAGAVRHLGGTPGRQTLAVDPARLPADVERVVVAATVDGGVFADVRDLALELHDAAGSVAASFPVRTAGPETLLLLAEVYRRQGGWRLRALGQGYDTGLAGLAADFGVTVDDEPPAPPRSAPAGDPISLRKEIVRVSLEKRGAAGVRARVALVLDRSGSMRPLYHAGVVGRLVERIAPVAAVVDDDSSLDAWIFADECARLPSLRVPQELEPWIAANVYIRQGNRQLPPLPDGSLRVPDHLVHVFGGNNEPEVIRDILDFYAAEPGDPVLVLFFSDGGINRSRQIQALLTKAAAEPVFWQFVGLGRSDYGILERFDTMPGRLVDNAGFFQVDDIDRITDAELYDRLLSEFPQWLTDARRAGVIR
ncbi:vWA domain-containing protein [Streptacidiphilus rugosus]|uniref:vWA domain-containing protein n=1 Tax=Streptacidiphilus rugosus TaxID=405783 RepID=UPI00056B5150|nr:VWA domain-containing protein [Streptacidiphilus rugosus]